MLFLVDGYNVTHSDPSTRDLDLEAQREALVRRLAARGQQMLGGGAITIIFDAAEGAGDTGAARGGIRVLFARQGTADDFIVRTVSAATDKVVVVTSDRGLMDRVRAHAPSVEFRDASACFESAGKGRSRRGKKPAPRRDAGLPAGANKITEELKRIWLDDE